MGFFENMFGGDPVARSEQKERVHLPKYMSKGFQETTQAVLDAGRQPFTPYTEQRFAEFTPDELRAQELTRGVYDRFDPFVSGGLNALGEIQRMGVEGPSQALIEGYMNPFLTNVLDVQQQRSLEDYQRAQQDLQRRAGQVSSFGGGRFGLESAQLQDDFRERQDFMEAQLLSQGYQQALGGVERGLTRAADPRSLAGLQGVSLGGIGALEGSGARQRMLEQQGLDFQFQEFMREQADPMLKAGFLARSLTPMAGTVAGRDVYGMRETKANEGWLKPTIATISSLMGLATGMPMNRGGPVGYQTGGIASVDPYAIYREAAAPDISTVSQRPMTLLDFLEVAEKEDRFGLESLAAVMQPEKASDIVWNQNEGGIAGYQQGGPISVDDYLRMGPSASQAPQTGPLGPSIFDVIAEDPLQALGVASLAYPTTAAARAGISAVAPKVGQAAKGLMSLAKKHPPTAQAIAGAGLLAIPKELENASEEELDAVEKSLEGVKKGKVEEGATAFNKMLGAVLGRDPNELGRERDLTEALDRELKGRTITKDDLSERKEIEASSKAAEEKARNRSQALLAFGAALASTPGGFFKSFPVAGKAYADAITAQETAKSKKEMELLEYNRKLKQLQINQQLADIQQQTADQTRVMREQELQLDRDRLQQELLIAGLKGGLTVSKKADLLEAHIASGGRPEEFEAILAEVERLLNPSAAGGSGVEQGAKGFKFLKIRE